MAGNQKKISVSGMLLLVILLLIVIVIRAAYLESPVFYWALLLLLPAFLVILYQEQHQKRAIPRRPVSRRGRVRFIRRDETVLTTPDNRNADKNTDGNKPTDSAGCKTALTDNRQPVFWESDYRLLKTYIRSLARPGVYDDQHAIQLEQELDAGALISDKAAFPQDTVRLYTSVTLLDPSDGQQLSFQLVPPALADLAKDRVSVLSPLGTAVIGKCKGQWILWELPEKRKTLFILHVNDPAA